MQFTKKPGIFQKNAKKNEFRKNSPATAPIPNGGAGQGMHPPSPSEGLNAGATDDGCVRISLTGPPAFEAKGGVELGVVVGGEVLHGDEAADVDPLEGDEEPRRADPADEPWELLPDLPTTGQGGGVGRRATGQMFGRKREVVKNGKLESGIQV